MRHRRHPTEGTAVNKLLIPFESSHIGFGGSNCKYRVHYARVPQSINLIRPGIRRTAALGTSGRKNTIMNNGTVRKRIILGFSAVILLMAGLCVFAYIQLRGIASQATALHGDSVPGLYLIGRLQ